MKKPKTPPAPESVLRDKIRKSEGWNIHQKLKDGKTPKKIEARAC